MKILVFVIVALCVSFALIILISPYASDKPDGLEYVAEQKGFLEKTEGKEILHKTLLPDYATPGVKDEKASTIIAGLAGSIACLFLGLIVAYLLKTKKKESNEARPSG